VWNHGLFREYREMAATIEGFPQITDAATSTARLKTGAENNRKLTMPLGAPSFSPHRFSPASCFILKVLEYAF
jgi:hypothetical protein